MSPARRKLSSAIHPADFDHIAANLRQCAIFPARLIQCRAKIRGTRHSAGLAKRRNDRRQLFLKPAEMLLFGAP
jgi:hypothetical protein